MPGRTFFDEDDPFFQAVDLWYGVTMDKEVRKLPFKAVCWSLTSCIVV